MHNIKNKIGLTLIELMLAIAILGILMMAMIQAFVFANVQIIRSGQHSQAVFETKQTIEIDLHTDPNHLAVDNHNVQIRFGHMEMDFDVDVFMVETNFGQNGQTVETVVFKHANR